MKKESHDLQRSHNCGIIPQRKQSSIKKLASKGRVHLIRLGPPPLLNPSEFFKSCHVVKSLKKVQKSPKMYY